MDLENIGISAGNQVDSARDRDYWRALVNEALNSGSQKPWSQLVSQLVSQIWLLPLKLILDVDQFYSQQVSTSNWKHLGGEIEGNEFEKKGNVGAVTTDGRILL